MRTNSIIAAPILAIAFLFAPGARGDGAAGLEETVRAQSLLINELKGELDELRAVRQLDHDRVLALEDRLASEDIVVTPEYVERGIEAFETAPRNRLFLSGYGVAQLDDPEKGDAEWNASFNPVFHFRLTDRLHFMGELEITLENVNGTTETEVEMEFAQIDYFAADWLTVSAGKMFAPFNVFGPKLHPQWINKLGSMPPIYGGHHGSGGLIPVISEAGAMLSGGISLWNESQLNYGLYLINSPSFEMGGDDHAAVDSHDDDHSAGSTDHDAGADDHDAGADDHDVGVDDHEGGTDHAAGAGDHEPGTDDHEPGADHDAGVPGDFLTDTTPVADSDEVNLAFGGRIGFLPIANLELGASFMSGRASASGDRFNLAGFDAWYRFGSVELRGEYARMSPESGVSIPDGYGYYAQLSHRNRDQSASPSRIHRLSSRLEPVVRWGAVRGREAPHTEQLAVGLNYWLYESVPIKLMYELNHGNSDGDRLVVQFSYGF